MIACQGIEGKWKMSWKTFLQQYMTRKSATYVQSLMSRAE